MQTIEVTQDPNTITVDSVIQKLTHEEIRQHEANNSGDEEKSESDTKALKS